MVTLPRATDLHYQIPKKTSPALVGEPGTLGFDSLGQNPRESKSIRPQSGLLNEILESLESGRADLLARGLRRDRDRLFGERIDALALFRRRLLHDAQLHETGNHEFARATRR